MKAALVYTSTTPELIELVEREVRKNIGEEAELISLSNPGILAEVREAGYVTDKHVYGCGEAGSGRHSEYLFFRRRNSRLCTDGGSLHRSAGGAY